ncbi:MAG: sugar ABC transporter permease [Gammaproteobacteria bacterium]|nr:sugar ABC transporter permease [Gammaproteobacteria bacterium]
MIDTKQKTTLLLLSPAIIVLVMVILGPLIFSLYSSFTPFKLTRPDSINQFIGFRNYVRIFGDEDFWAAFVRTIVVLTIALNLEMLLGLGLALLVNRATMAQKTLRTIMMFPMMFSPILVGFQFRFMFNDNIGVVNNALQSLGITQEAIPWLVDKYLAIFSICVAEIWNSTSVFAILILAGLMSLPKDPLEAAEVDGCTKWQTFRHVTLPYLMPFLYIAMTIRSLDIARAYDIVQIMTGGGPAQRTELLWTMIARTGYVDAKMGMANAMSYVAILLSIFFTVFFFRKLNQARHQLGVGL